MNFFDVLAAEKWGGGIPTINFFDLLFAQSMGGGEQWETYEGTLPATINANGADMRQYQIYGNTGGVGEPTGNLFDISTSVRGKYIAADGSEGISAMGDPFKQLNHSDFIEIRNDEEYYFSYNGDTLTGGQTLAMCWFDDSKTLITRKTQSVSSGVNTYAINDTAPSNAKYLIINFAAWNNNSRYMLTEGLIAPASYVPYGYEADMSVSDGTNTTTTPIYIGDTPLGNGEYVDYQAKKIYRMINGTLTPTDPPTPLPALPTCDGTTVVGYAGQSVAPEKVVFEYAKGGS